MVTQFAERHSLPVWQLRMAIAAAVIDRVSFVDLKEKLHWVEPEDLKAHYDAIHFARMSLDPVTLEKDCLRKRRGKARLPARDKVGVTLNEFATLAGLNRATLVALLEHHGFVELAYYGGRQRRCLVTQTAYDTEFGHNVTPSNRVVRLDGHNRTAVFPVFYRERLADILWCLDYDGIRGRAASISNKRQRLKWLLENHSYLPDQEVADLAGCTRRGVIAAKTREVHRVAA